MEDVLALSWLLEPVEADHRAGHQHEREPPSRIPVPPHPKTPPAAQPGRKLKTPNGAGSIVKRGDGRWMARYTVRDPESGRSLRKHLYAKTEQEARALLIEALEARRRGWLSVRPGRGPSLQEYAQRWLAAGEDRIRPRSIHRYRELLERHVLARLGRVQISQLEPRQVNAVMLEARTRGLSVRTCNYIRVTLRAMLSEAQRDAW
jgi:integrase-like protein